MYPLDLVKLAALMELTSGSPQIKIALIDGPVVTQHPSLVGEHLREIQGSRAECTNPESTACRHGTFVAGILGARRNSGAPAICPGCTILIRPIFSEAESADGGVSATPQELARAILDCIDSGASVLNLSGGLARPSLNREPALEAALDRAARRGVLVIAAAGNQGTLGSTAITRHPWVIPVVAYNLRGGLLHQSNLGNSIGRFGLGAPGERITSLGSNGQPLTLGGTSAAAPFVTGAVALLWSKFPAAGPMEIKSAIMQSNVRRRATVTPPLLDAWRSYQCLLATNQGRGMA